MRVRGAEMGALRAVVDLPDTYLLVVAGAAFMRAELVAGKLL